MGGVGDWPFLLTRNHDLFEVHVGHAAPEVIQPWPTG